MQRKGIFPELIMPGFVHYTQTAQDTEVKRHSVVKFAVNSCLDEKNSFVTRTVRCTAKRNKLMGKQQAAAVPSEKGHGAAELLPQLQCQSFQAERGEPGRKCWPCSERQKYNGDFN